MLYNAGAVSPRCFHRFETAPLFHRLQRRVTELVHNGADFRALFAERAFLGGIAGITGEVAGIEQGDHRHAVDFRQVAVDGGDPRKISAVIVEAADPFPDGAAGSDRGQQEKDILPFQHRLGVVTEDQHIVFAEVFAEDEDFFTGVDGAGAVAAALGKMTCETGTDNAGAVHTEDGVDHGIGKIALGELLGNGVGILQAGLLPGDINKIIGMAVSGRKMSLSNTQGHVADAYREFKELRLHKYDLLIDSFSPSIPHNIHNVQTKFLLKSVHLLQRHLRSAGLREFTEIIKKWHLRKETLEEQFIPRFPLSRHVFDAAFPVFLLYFV